MRRYSYRNKKALIDWYFVFESKISVQSSGLLCHQPKMLSDWWMFYKLSKSSEVTFIEAHDQVSA